MIKIRPKPKNLQLCENGPPRKYKCRRQTPPNTVYLLGKFHWFFVHMFDYGGRGSIHQIMWILSMQGLLPTPWMLWLETGWKNASYHYFIPCVWQSFFQTIRFAKATGTAEGRFETRGTHKAWLSWNATPSTQNGISHLSLLIVIFKNFVFLLACVWLFLGLFLLGFLSVLLRLM